MARRSRKRRRRARKLALLACAVTVIALGAGAYYVNPLLLVGAGYHAKTLCSGVFVSGREASAVEREDIAAGRHLVLKLIRSQVDRERRSVSAGFFGLPQREAVFRNGLGCTLALGVDADELRAYPPVAVATEQSHPERPWPQGDAVDVRRLPPRISATALNAAVDAAFSEPDSLLPRRTRAVVIVYDDHIVAERYAPGFSPTTPQIGWSLSKTATSALVGVLVGEHKLALDQPAPIAEWRHPGDARGAITLDQLLRMTSGLSFSEDKGAARGDLVAMLFATPDMAAYAATKPLLAAPGSVWRYSTGTTNIVSRIVRDTAGPARELQLSFPRRALFDRIGMTSAVMEVDASGNYVGSAFLYASARDWARLGLLYLHDGVWFGDRILPRGWVRYSRTSTPESNGGDFGAHVWLRVPKPYFRQTGERPLLPPDTFHFAGHHAQFVSVIPSRKLVVVRMGLSAPWSWDQEEFLVQVLNALATRIVNAASMPF